MANNQGIITRAFPPGERGRALGINATAVALGALAGPALGGFIITVASWEYLFWLNVPIGLAAYFANRRFPDHEQQPCGEKLDIRGALLFMLFIAPLFISLEYGQSVGYGQPLILAAFGVSLLAGIVFLLLEARLPMPMLDLSLFKDKWYAISIFCAFISYVTISCSNIVLPFYLQNVLGLAPDRAGLFMTISPLALTVISPASGALSDRVGPEILTLIGLCLSSLGLFLMASLDLAAGFVTVGCYILLMALGQGFFQSPNTSLVMSLVPRNKLGIGGSVNAMIRNMGFALGVALATSLLYGGISARLGYRVHDILPGQEAAFMFGMRLVYGVSGAVSLIGAAITAFRLYGRRQPQPQG